MQFGAVGDLHGDFDTLDGIMARHPEIAFWVCPGDLASESGEYPKPLAPLYWIKGNNEEFDFVASQPPGGGTIPNLHYIPNGVAVQAHGLTLAGLGGTFAPTWYETPAAQLPGSVTEARSGGGRAAATKSDRRRHFVREEVRMCAQLPGVDVFLTHEAPRPFVLEQTRASGVTQRVDAGKTPINEVLTAMKPRLHLFGHHHRYGVAERQHVPSIGLELVSTSYLIFDGKTLAHERLLTPHGQGPSRLIS
jgi:calcineurin-like phosphoesterase family protein